MNSIHTKNTKDLRQVDLNLLVALDALLTSASVTRAAVELSVTQSAMSHTLARLRELLQDPLLVRTGSRLTPTPRAQRLVAPLRLLLSDASKLLAGDDTFEPTLAQRTFRLTAPDLIDLLLLPRLCEQLKEKAPSVDLAAVPLPRDISEALELGDIDIAIVPSLLHSDAPFGPQATHGLMKRTLTKDDFRVFLRKDHPFARSKSLSLKRFLTTPHLLVSPTGKGDGFVDALLAEQGKTRRIGLRITTFSAALSVLEQSDLLLVGPSSLAQVHGVTDRLCALKSPIPLPNYAISMVWHPRYGAEPGLTWLREQIASTTATWSQQKTSSLS